MMEKFIEFLVGDPYKMDESWQQTWAYFVGCKMPYILRDWHDPSFREGDVWKKDGAFYESLRLKLDGMSAFKKKCDDSDDTLEALKLLVDFFAHERSKRAAANSGIGRGKRRGAKKNDGMKNDGKEYEKLVSDISEMAKSLAGLYEQSCAILKPIVDDACRNPGTYSENELEHLFDQLLNVSCSRNGKRLFDRLCKRFRSIYPDAVQSYIDIDKEMYGEENDD